MGNVCGREHNVQPSHSQTASAVLVKPDLQLDKDPVTTAAENVILDVHRSIVSNRETYEQDNHGAGEARALISALESTFQNSSLPALWTTLEKAMKSCQDELDHGEQ